MKRIILFLFLALFIAMNLTACFTVVPKRNTGTGESGAMAEKNVTESPTWEPTETPEQDAKIHPGHYLQKDTFKFTFERASLYDEISGEYFNDTPADGKKYLACFFEVENVSDDDAYVSSAYIKAYLNDYTINESFLLNDIEGYKALGGELQPGKKQKGYICYEVGADWEKLEFTYTDGFFDAQTYDFIVTPDDIT